MILVKAINEEVSFLKKKRSGIYWCTIGYFSGALYFCLCGSTWNSWVDSDYGGWELYGTYSLAEDQVIQIGDTNV